MKKAKGVLHDFNDAKAKDVDNFIETYRKYFEIPGVSLALIKDGKLVYHKTYGVKNTFTGEKVDSNTLFEAASITKPVFALAVEKLAERGVIDLDKPLYEYLPYKDIEYARSSVFYHGNFHHVPFCSFGERIVVGVVSVTQIF